MKGFSLCGKGRAFLFWCEVEGFGFSLGCFAVWELRCRAVWGFSGALTVFQGLRFVSQEDYRGRERQHCP